MSYNTNSIRHWVEDERPREKLIHKGKSALSDAELLAILFNTGIKGLSAIQLAKNILQLANNNLVELSRLDFETLKNVKGVGPKKAVVLLSALELGNRRRFAEALEKPSISSSKDAFECLAPYLADSSTEKFIALYLNRANKLIRCNTHSTGGVAGTIVDVKLLMKEAILLNASSIIVAHNHPSGNLNPSSNDLRMTENIKAASKFLDLPLLDHLIVTGDGYFSFKDEGLLG